MLRANKELKTLSGRDNRFIDNTINWCSWQSIILCSLAQCFCITGMATRDHWFGGIEESMWTFANAFLFPCALFLYSETLQIKKLQNINVNLKSTQQFLFMMIIVSFGFAIYVGFEHVPILLNASAEEHAKGVKFLPFWEGLQHCMTYRKVSRTYKAWETTWLWQGAYFSFGAWASLFMATGPRVHLKTKVGDEGAASKSGSVKSAAYSMRSEVNKV